MRQRRNWAVCFQTSAGALSAVAAVAALHWAAATASAQYVSISNVAANGIASIDTNSCAIDMNTLTTAGGYQFITYYNSSSHVMVGRRAIGSSTWTTFDSGYTGATGDDHDIAAIAVDSAGMMHLSWGMHNIGLQYAISNVNVTAASLPSLTFTTQTSVNAPTLFAGPSNSVTYPQFYSIPNSSNLMFTYRNGSSGSGNQYVNVYNPNTNTWTNNLAINGDVTSVNAYLNSMAYTSTGTLMMSWTWRATPAWQTNSNIMFAQSPDNGTTWYQQGGTTQYTLPIIQSGSPASSVAQVIQTIPQNSSLINQTSMTVDRNDRPIIATWWAPGWDTTTNSGNPNRQYMLVYYDGATWRTSQISNRTTDTSIDTSAFAVRDLGRPVVLTDSSGHVLVVTRSTDTVMGGFSNPATTDNEIVVYYNTVASLDSATPGAWKSVTLDTANMGASEPCIDMEMWKTQGKLSMFYQATQLGASSSAVGVLDWDAAAYFANLALQNTWNLSAGGAWETAGNWSNGLPVANAGVFFGTGNNAPTADSTITLSGTKTVGAMTFNSVNYKYTLASGVSGAIVLDNGTANAATIAVDGGVHEIAVPVTLSSVGNTVTMGSGTKLTISGNVTGSGGLTKAGSGILVLSGSNTYSGTTTVNGGVLIADGAAFSANTNLTINGGYFGSTLNKTLGTGAGQVQITGGTSGFTAETGNVTITLNGGAALTWGAGNFAPSVLMLNSSSAAGNLVFANPVALGNVARTINVGASSATMSGALSGSGSLTKTGAGTLVLTAAGTYTGATTVTGGVLQVNAALATSGVTLTNNASGVFRIAPGGTAGANAINIASDGSGTGPTNRFEVTGGVSVPNAVTLAQRNNASVAIESLLGNNTLGGVITLAVGGGQARVQSDAGTLTIAGNVTTNATSTRNLYLQGAGNGVVSGIIANNGANGAGTILVHKEGTGVWALTGANTFGGGVAVDGGTLELGSAGAVGSTGTIAFGGGTLRYTASNTTDYSTRIGNSAGAVSIDTNGQNVTFAGVLAATNTGGLTKNGAGTLVLSAANAYSGVTTVNGGVLVLGNGTTLTDTYGAATGSGTLLVSANANITSNAMTVGAYTVNGKHTIANGSGASRVEGAVVFGAAGRLNLGDTSLVVQSTPATVGTVVATLAQKVAAARNGGAWNGTTGISQATVAANPSLLTLAVAPNASIANPLSTIGGVAVDANSVLVVPAILGDADLSGGVDLADYDRWYRGVGTGAYDYTKGDFDGSGTVDLADYDLWYKHVGASAPVLAGGAAAVPEPMTLAVLGIGALGLLGRRRISASRR